ncbi:short chain dehydrogenase [Variovorax sp. PBS-H4]|uniref:NAD-dependent epimerase/dehydratase family protein n=1 Tax=Variovorax sp. PBS-H4 TaxID=434008 RepID=UPI001315B16A|nr:NAD(P)-dependent oxidoreductase [Variovorax sp. PBS-H4]VTU18617.1 short chain dehydrogenase [Variovorax sp. PBS-H4]
MTQTKIFLAGATGAIGSVLAPLLVDAGYAVYGSTRRAERASALEAQDVAPVVVDVFDAAALASALKRIAPDVVIHQLTDLPRDLDPARMAEAVVRNARVRSEGTRNLVAGSLAAGCGRLIAQSIAWAYAPGPKPLKEEQPLDVTADDARGITVRGVAALEALALDTPGLTGTVLRYGQLYGPGTSTPTPRGATPVHVEAAAWAALLAVQRDGHGIYNIAEESPELSTEKAGRELGWHAALRWPAEVLK